MKAVLLKLFLLIAHVVGVQSVRCKSCENLYHPKDCTNTVMCGIGEVCFSEEYTDYNGKSAHRLGCTHRNGCKVSRGSGGLIGKRANSGECFRCCEKDDCNINLCFNQKPDTWNCSETSGCPDMFVPFQGSCYMVSMSSGQHVEAKRHCQALGAELASIHSLQESDFLFGEIARYNVSYERRFATGGYYELGFGSLKAGWRWQDGSVFNFTDYGPRNAPPTNLSPSSNMFVFLQNPVHYQGSPVYWEYQYWSHRHNYPLICKKPMA